MGKLCLGLVFLVLGFSSVGLSDLKFYEYRLPSHPKLLESCHLTAKELGNVFFNATLTKAYSSICEAQVKDSCNILITYEAEEPLSVVSTDQAFFGLDPEGGFATEEACVNAIEEEKRRFQFHVGLDPAFTYCYKAPYSSSLPWELRIDAFGESAVKPQLSGAHLFGLPSSPSPQEFVKEVRQSLIDKGIDYSYVVFRSHLAYLRMSVRYYAPKRINLKEEFYVQTYYPERCKTQLSELTKVFKETHTEALSIYCSNIIAGGHFELTALVMGEENFSVRPTLERFDSYEVCQQERETLLAYYKTELGRPVIGGVCTRKLTLKDFYVQLFESLPQG